MQHVVRTYTGRLVDIDDPDPGTISIVDIAHQLALTNRYAGATIFPYSVAEHCVRMARIVPEDLRLEALLHDASEAYLNDMPAPIKVTLRDYRAAEFRVTRAVRAAFGLLGDPPRDLEYFDMQMRATEIRDLNPSWEPEDGLPDPLPDVIEPWKWTMAKFGFRARYEILVAQ